MQRSGSFSAGSWGRRAAAPRFGGYQAGPVERLAADRVEKAGRRYRPYSEALASPQGRSRTLCRPLRRQLIGESSAVTARVQRLPASAGSPPTWRAGRRHASGSSVRQDDSPSPSRPASEAWRRHSAPRDAPRPMKSLFVQSGAMTRRSVARATIGMTVQWHTAH